MGGRMNGPQCPRAVGTVQTSNIAVPSPTMRKFLRGWNMLYLKDRWDEAADRGRPGARVRSRILFYLWSGRSQPLLTASAALRLPRVARNRSRNARPRDDSALQTPPYEQSLPQPADRMLLPNRE